MTLILKKKKINNIANIGNKESTSVRTEDTHNNLGDTLANHYFMTSNLTVTMTMLIKQCQFEQGETLMWYQVSYVASMQDIKHHTISFL